MSKAALVIFAVATSIKLLLIPSYRSTDFEVHRNWLAITYQLPLKRWYFENTSEWTLDYPPFFAAFEWFLAQIAALLPIDPNILKISATPYISQDTIIFQRLTVISSDLVLLFGVLANIQASKPFLSREATAVFAGLVLLNGGLLMVDHIHFQYNGMMLGLLLFSIACIRQGQEILGGILFATVLMFKHLFLSLAPVYFIYLLAHYCIHFNSSTKNGSSSTTSSSPQFLYARFIALGASVVAVFGLALSPFLLLTDNPKEQLLQILHRLFPFGRGLVHAYWTPYVWSFYCLADVLVRLIGRGLVHAYWAPNVWSFYCLADVILGCLLRKAGLIGAPSQGKERPTWTSGLVQVIQPEVLFKVTPPMTAIAVLLSMIPALIFAWHRANRSDFIYALFQTSLCAFMLGWHVHEKAIIVSILLLTLLAVQEARYARLYLWLSAIGHASLLPLFPALTADALSAYLLIQSHLCLSYCALVHIFPKGQLHLSVYEKIYLGGLQGLLLLVLVIHPWLLVDRFPFLARLVSSVYCAIGLTVVWTQSYVYLLPLTSSSSGGSKQATTSSASSSKKKQYKVQ